MSDEKFAARRPIYAIRIRDALNRYLTNHSPNLASHQAHVHHPWLDVYFKYSSLLGTHTFFMLFLPPVYQIGGPPAGRILILTSALAVYVTAIIKDFLCVPRPTAPPVRRLVIGTHHLEYGFPSTHSANSMGMSVCFYYAIKGLRPIVNALFTDDYPLLTYMFTGTYLMESIILLYAFTIVYGRLYAGMHSVLVGSCIGATVAFFSMWIDPYLGDFIVIGKNYVPLVIFGSACLSLAIHIPPVEPCPCYEDAVAFVGAWTGVVLGNWRLDDYYQLDKARVDTVFHGLLYLIPECVQAPLKSIWLYANDSLSFKVFMSLMIGVIPLVLFRMFASPAIKTIFVRTYLAIVKHLRKKTMLCQNAHGLATNSITQNRANQPELRECSEAVQRPRLACSDEFNISQWKTIDEKICIDGPRLIIYVGMGALGAWLSVLLIDYFQVKVIEFVSIS